MEKKVFDLSSIITHEDIHNFVNEYQEYLSGATASLNNMRNYLTEVIYIDDYQKSNMAKVFDFANESRQCSADLIHLTNILKDNLTHKTQLANDLLKELARIKLLVNDLQERLTRVKQLSVDRQKNTIKTDLLYEDLQEHLANAGLFSADFQDYVVQDKQLFEIFREHLQSLDEIAQKDMIRMEFSLDDFMDFVAKVEHSWIDLPQEWIKTKQLTDAIQENKTQGEQIGSDLEKDMMAIKDLANNLDDDLTIIKQSFDNVLNHMKESLLSIGNLSDYLKYIGNMPNKNNTIN